MDNDPIIALERDVSASRPEFMQGLRLAFPAGIVQQGNGICIETSDSAMAIDLEEIPPRVVGALQLPRLRVRISFTRGSAVAQTALLARMDRAMQRGGQCETDAALHLRADHVRIHRDSAIDRAHDAGLAPIGTLVALRLGSCLSVAVALVVLRGTGRVGRLHADRRTVRAALASAALGDVIGNLIYITANAIGTLSVTVVLGSLYPASTVVLAAIVLHERLTRQQLGGVALALAGAALISAGSIAA